MIGALGADGVWEWPGFGYDQGLGMVMVWVWSGFGQYQAEKGRRGPLGRGFKIQVPTRFWVCSGIGCGQVLGDYRGVVMIMVCVWSGFACGRDLGVLQVGCFRYHAHPRLSSTLLLW